MPWRLQSEPNKVEKIVAGLCYFTFGLSGLIYILVSKNRDQSQLFRFHMYQAVFLSILATLISWAVNPLLDIMLNVMGAVAPQVVPGFAGAIGWIALVISTAFKLLLLYGAVWAFLGKFAEVPFISSMVRQNMRY